MDIVEQLSKYWQYIGRLSSFWPQKSDIEYVILAGSSLLGVFEGNNVFFGVGDGLWAAQRAIFSRISGFWYPIAQNFARPQGHLSEDWKGLAPGSLSIGNILAH